MRREDFVFFSERCTVPQKLLDVVEGTSISRPPSSNPPPNSLRNSGAFWVPRASLCCSALPMLVWTPFELLVALPSLFSLCRSSPATQKSLDFTFHTLCQTQGERKIVSLPQGKSTFRSLRQRREEAHVYQCLPYVALLILSPCWWQEAEPTHKKADQMLTGSENTQKKEHRSKSLIYNLWPVRRRFHL